MKTRAFVFFISFLLLLMPDLMLLQACRSLPLLLQTQQEARRLSSLHPYRHYPLTLSSSQLPHNGPDKPRSTAASILALLGGKHQAASVNSSLSQQLLSCLRFLVPLEPRFSSSTVSELGLGLNTAFPKDHALKHSLHAIDNLIHWPPASVAELARQTVEWGGDATVILNALSGDSYPVPDVEGASEHHCQLAKHTYGRRFENKELNQYMAFLFEVIAALAPSVGFNVSLNRFDLFHGHMFLATNTGRLGILFHAREYPAFSKEKFPVNLGYCQVGSHVVYDESVNLRNILWLAPMPDCSGHNCSKKWLAPGSLLILDAHPDGIIYQDLVSEYVDVVRTIYEDDFGAVVLDVNYLSVMNEKPEGRIFMC